MAPADPGAEATPGARATDDFRVASAVGPHAHVPGCYHADIPPGWNSPVGVHGGVLVATIVRAMLAAHGADPRPDGPDERRSMELRTVHASFLERPHSGRLVIDTDVVRVGGTTAHVEATARSHGQDETAARVWGLFARPRANVGSSYLDAVHPDVPSPDQARVDDASSFGAPVVPPLFDQFEFRSVIGELPWSPTWTPDQPARFARWNRYRVPPTIDGGVFDALALLPIADLPATALWVRSRPGDPFLAVVSLEMTVNFLEPPRSEWVLADFRARWFGDGYVFTEADLWSDGRLVAVSSQLMIVRELPPP